MLINPLFLIKDPVIIQGLLSGSLTRYGGVIREAATGRIVRHLVETPSMTNYLMTMAANPILGTANLITNAFGHGITIDKLKNVIDNLDIVSNQVSQVQETLSPILGLSQVAAGASVLNLGVSVAGFAYMDYKLNQVQTSLGKMQQIMEAGFANIDDHLNAISGHLAYLQLLVEQNRQGQIHLAEKIDELHRTILIKEIAELRAELIERDRFPDTSIQSALKVAAKVRMIMSDRALQIMPELEPQKMLLADVATQGWAVATTTEAHLLLEVGKFEDAEEILSFEVPRFKRNAERWANSLLTTERPELNTAYRFTAPLFKEHISQERVIRIADISDRDRNLSPEKQQEKLDDIVVEFQMSYASQFDRHWIYKQVAIAEYLDTFSELTARLESLQAFTSLCQKADVNSSRDLLPSKQMQEGWYTLPSIS
ncbi:hypothetical protein [Myxosarcina sp. GI1]|uniref:hypothetical protein n=1 Tax=Myxosarcina sp. GI1 TaxID=1541065 RepID=UPI000560B6D9|nr:hypothetical protein [Myxosarcina sp. GI1]